MSSPGAAIEPKALDVNRLLLNVKGTRSNVQSVRNNAVDVNQPRFNVNRVRIKTVNVNQHRFNDNETPSNSNRTCKEIRPPALGWRGRAGQSRNRNRHQ